MGITLSLPNPGMDFTAFDILTAAEMDDLVENIEALADGTGLDNNVITTAKILDGNVTTAKLAAGSVTVDKISLSSDADEIDTPQTTTSTTPADLATPGPSVTIVVPTSGRVLVAFATNALHSSANSRINAGVNLSGANTVAANFTATRFLQIVDSTTSVTAGGSKTYIYRGLTPGSTTFKMQYWGNTGTKTFESRILSVIALP